MTVETIEYYKDLAERQAELIKELNEQGQKWATWVDELLARNERLEQELYAKRVVSQCAAMSVLPPQPDACG